MGVLSKLVDAAKRVNAAATAEPTAAPAPKPVAPKAPPSATSGRPAIPVDMVPGAGVLREGIRRRQRIMDEL